MESTLGLFFQQMDISLQAQQQVSWLQVSRLNSILRSLEQYYLFVISNRCAYVASV